MRFAESMELPGAQAARFSFTRLPATAESGSASALRASAAARASAAKALQRSVCELCSYFEAYIFYHNYLDGWFE